MLDLAIAGGGPAGLATAIAARQAGFSALVLERAGAAPDKACGEGLMPRGLDALRALGALERIAPGGSAPFHGIRYVLAGGRSVEGRFRGGSGLGVRRTALAAALEARARELGAELRRASVRGYSITGAGVSVDTDQGPVEARLLVAADGLHSPLRKRAGLSLPAGGPRRFGLRRHFCCAPWSDLVEVHWADGVECYVTPVGPERVNLAFLWDDGLRGAAPAEGDAIPDKPGFEALLALFPAVEARVHGAPAESESRGAGPLLQPVRARAAAGLALVGDAAGYVDAITGQGLSLAFRSARSLVAALPRPLDPAALPAVLAAWDRSLRGPWLRYALPARGLLALASRPRLRRAALGAVSRSPRLFSALLALVG